MYLSDRPRRWVGKQKKKIISKGQILLCQITHLFAIFGSFLGRYKVCWVDLRLPTTKRVKLQYIFSVSVSFLATFFVIFGKFFGFYRYFFAFFAILSVFLGIFSGIQDGVLPVAPIGA